MAGFPAIGLAHAIGLPIPGGHVPKLDVTVTKQRGTCTYILLCPFTLFPSICLKTPASSQVIIGN